MFTFKLKPTCTTEYKTDIIHMTDFSPHNNVKQFIHNNAGAGGGEERIARWCLAGSENDMFSPYICDKPDFQVDKYALDSKMTEYI